MERIDRHNYEEFFILYLDKELSDEQRRQVEEFIQNNPDLEEELEVLSHYKFSPETNLVFEQKDQLYKEETLSDIDVNNYQEWMLLYVDAELTPGQQGNLEGFLRKYPARKKELQDLQQARLSPESISFPDKEVLYKRSTRKRPIPLYWWRAAAILLMILLAGTAVLIRNNNQTPGNEALVNQPGSTTPLEQPPSPDKVFPFPARDEEIIQPSILASKETKQLKQPVVPNNSNNLGKLNREEKKENLFADQLPGNNLPVHLENQTIATINTTPKENIKEDQLPAIKTELVTNNSTAPSNIINATYTEDAIEQPDGKKNKLRGLFRKLTRTVEKTTHVKATDDDDRLLIGGLAIRLK